MSNEMPVERPTPLGLALQFLRSARGWTRQQLSRALEILDDSLLGRYERGKKALTRENAEEIIAPLEVPTEALDALVLVYGLIQPEPVADLSPVALTREELRQIARAVLAGMCAAGEELHSELIRARKKEKAEAARAEAGELWARLRAAAPQERRDLVAAFPQLQSWALAERLCEASERAAAHKPEEALELAELALFVAERSPGEEAWRSRLQGYCWAFVGNSRRVFNDFASADLAFASAWQLWRAGAESHPRLLPEWRLLDLEASLRRAQHRFKEALALLDRALAASQGRSVATGRLLLKKGNVFEQMGDSRRALKALAEAASLLEGSGETRLLFGLHFDTANNLCLIGSFEDAQRLLPRVRELAVEQGNELDLIRVLWLEARAAAGLGQIEAATAGLERVWRDFTARQLPYDAALSSLELAVLYLEAGLAAKVRQLAVAMAWIFKAQGITREVLAALRLFCQAAEQEAATVELARRAIADIEQARRSATRADRA